MSDLEDVQAALSEATSQLEIATRKQAELEGERKSVMSDLKERFEVDSLTDAESKCAALKAEVAETEAQIEAIKTEMSEVRKKVLG